MNKSTNIFRRIARGVLFSVLKRFARMAVNKHDPYVIGITGSVGKTTAKELVAHLLSERFKVVKSPHNANTEWGVVATLIDPTFSPTLTADGKGMVTLWQAIKLLLKGLGHLLINQNYPQVLVLELAVDRPRDMKVFNSFLTLDVAVITNIGQTHLEFFPNQEALTQAKWEITKGLKATGVLLANGDNDLIAEKLKTYDKKYYTYGWNQSNDFSATATSPHGAEIEASFSTPKGQLGARMPLGRQLVLGALPAVAIGQFKAMSAEEISRRLSLQQSLSGRFEVYKLSRGMTLINDAYNANPDSMKSAILSMQDIAKGRKVVILGGMAELGSAHLPAHRMIGEFVVGRVDLAIFIGAEGKLMAESAQGGNTEIKWMSQPDRDEIISLLSDNDTVLVKASRVHGLDKIAGTIKEKLK